MKCSLQSVVLVSCCLLLTATGSGQYGYPGYYPYPPPYGHYPPQQQQRPRERQKQQRNRDKTREEAPQQREYQQVPRQEPQRRSAAPKPEAPAAKPPSADISTITGPFISYTWDFEDTFEDLASATSTTTYQILALNNLAMSQLRDGQVLKVPEFVKTEGLDIEADPVDQMAREVWRGIRGQKRIALTFDAGGDPDAADLLLKNLRDNQVPATFFATGTFAEDHPEIVKQMSDSGYRVHNHSWSHPDFRTISNDQIASELSRTDEALQGVTGQSTKPYWRPPFGERDDRVLRSAAENGYVSIYWTLDSLDSVDEPKSADFVITRITSPPKHKLSADHFLDGAIVLMHVGKSGTAEAIPELVRQLRGRGFTFVSLDEILKP